jgi:hypothetical protein
MLLGCFNMRLVTLVYIRGTMLSEIPCVRFESGRRYGAGQSASSINVSAIEAVAAMCLCKMSDR